MVRKKFPDGVVQTEAGIVGLYPTSQTTDFVVANAFAELSRRQKAALGPREPPTRLLATSHSNPNRSLAAVSHW